MDDVKKVFEYDEADMQPIETGEISRITRMVDLLAAKQKEMADLEAKLEVVKEEARKLREINIPELMRACGVDKMHTTSGLDVVIKTAVRASFPKDPDKKKIAFDWLAKNNHDNLIKRQITVTFDKDETKWAQKFMRDLEKRKRPLQTVLKEEIHNQTLCAFLKGELDRGTDVPLASFGAFVQTYAKID